MKKLNTYLKLGIGCMVALMLVIFVALSLTLLPAYDTVNSVMDAAQANARMDVIQSISSVLIALIPILFVSGTVLIVIGSLKDGKDRRGTKSKAKSRSSRTANTKR